MWMVNMKRLLLICVVYALMISGCYGRIEPHVSTDSGDYASGGTGTDHGSDALVTYEESEQEPEIPLKELRFAPEQAKQILIPDESGVVFISAPRDLAALATLVNSGDEWYRDFKYVLQNNINMSGIDFIPIGGTNEEGYSHSFEASFFGNSCLIQGLTIRNNGFESGTGLFGAVGPSGFLEDVHVVEANIKGQVCTGGIVGAMAGSMRACSFRGKVSGSNDVGGLFGTAFSDGETPGSVSQCAANAEVTGFSTLGAFGGVASVGVRITDCYALGSVTILEDDAYDRQGYIGGFLGQNTSDSLERCFAVTEVYTKISSDFVGAFIGYNAGTVLSCYFGDYLAGWDGVCYEADSEIIADVTGCSVENITSQETYLGWDFGGIWGIREGKNRGLPYLITISGE